MTFDLATGRTYPSVEALQAVQKLYRLRCVQYTPDFEVDLGVSKILVEVKHRELISMKPAILGYPNILARYGYRLVIIDDEILEETYIRNLRLLNLARNVQVPSTEFARLVEFIAAGVTYGDLLAAGFDEAIMLAALANGHVTCDVRSARLNHSTRVVATGDTTTHLKDLPLVCR